METPNYLKSIFNMSDEIIKQQNGIDNNLSKNLNDIKEEYILMIDGHLAKMGGNKNNKLLKECGNFKIEIEAAFEQYIESKQQIN
jgi:hypothetical protein